MKNKQKGYFNLDFTGLFILAGIGLVFAVINIVWLIIWILQNLRITIG